MRRRVLGRTGLLVSEVALGTVEIGMAYGFAAEGESAVVSTGEAERLLHHALDRGINLIDTAPAYGEAESRIGAALGGRRDEFVLATKVAARAGEIEGSLEASLRALRTDHVEILQLHSAGVEALRDPAVTEALERVRRRGLARHFGVTVYGEEAALAAMACPAYECIQIAWSALDRRPERRLLAEAERRGVGVLVRSVLLKGVLSHRWRVLPERLAGLARAAKALEAIGMDLAELGYRYILGQEGAFTALVGARTMAEVDAAVRYSEAGALPAEVMEAVRCVVAEPERLLDPTTWEA